MLEVVFIKGSRMKSYLDPFSPIKYHDCMNIAYNKNSMVYFDKDVADQRYHGQVDYIYKISIVKIAPLAIP